MSNRAVGSERDVRLGEEFLLRRSQGSLVLRCPFEPPGWVPRREGDQLRADHPGTAVSYAGTFYEVISGEGSSASDRIRYRLDPWDDRFRMSAPIELSSESCRAWEGEHARIGREERTARTLHWLAPFVGLLPAEDQLNLESRLGISAGRSTVLSAGLLFVISLAIVAFGLPALLVPGFAEGHPLMQKLPVLLLPAGYFVVESWARFNIGMNEWRPVGSLPVVLVISAARAVRSALSRDTE